MKRAAATSILSALALALTLTAAGPASAAPAAADASAGAGSTVDPPSAGDVLSPRLQTLQSSGVAADSPAAATQLGVTSSGAGSLQVDAAARVAVNIRYATPPTDADIAQVAAVGDVRSVARDYNVITAYVPVGSLDALKANPAVASIAEVVQPATGGPGIRSAASAGSASVARATAAISRASSPATDARALTAAAASCRSIPVDADAPLNSAAAREAFGVDGTGVSVGVISNSYDVYPSAATTAEQDVESGLLPGVGNPCGYTTPVDVVAEAVVNPQSPPDDEGRAMAQLVHGVAPGARLLFATSGESGFTMASSIDQLVANGATVIVDDITLLDDPIFQEGPVDAAIRRARDAGVLYLSSAGNASIAGAANTPSAGHQIGSWATSAYRPTTCPAAALDLLAPSERPLSDCQNFAQTGSADPTDSFTFADDHTPAMFMQWAEPLYGVHSTFSFALIDHSTGQVVVASYQSDPTAPATTAGFSDQYPTDASTRYDLVIIRTTTASDPLSDITPAIKFLLVQGSGVRSAEYDTSTGDDVVGPTITGHASSPDAIAVAAVPYTAPTTPETFTSTGPATHYFAPADGITPAAPLAHPQAIAKPDVTSADGERTSMLGSPTVTPGEFTFFGTSAAAPTAAAVVALATEYTGSTIPETIATSLRGTATPITSGFAGVRQHDVTGAGLVNADALLAALPQPTPPTPTPTPTPTPVPTPGPTQTAVPQPGIPNPTANANAAARLANTGAPAPSPLLIGGALLAALIGTAAVAALGAGGRRRAARRD